jgi:hypothetical protein
MSITNIGTEFAWTLVPYRQVLNDNQRYALYYSIKLKMHGIICDDIFGVES